jgi:hypothetical protein
MITASCVGIVVILLLAVVGGEFQWFVQVNHECLLPLPPAPDVVDVNPPTVSLEVQLQAVHELRLFYGRSMRNETYCRLVRAPHLLAALQLDLRRAPRRRPTLARIARLGSGWPELTFVSNRETFLVSVDDFDDLSMFWMFPVVGPCSTIAWQPTPSTEQTCAIFDVVEPFHSRVLTSGCVGGSETAQLVCLRCNATQRGELSRRYAANEGDVRWLAPKAMASVRDATFGSKDAAAAVGPTCNCQQPRSLPRFGGNRELRR